MSLRFCARHMCRGGIDCHGGNRSEKRPMIIQDHYRRLCAGITIAILGSSLSARALAGAPSDSVPTTSASGAGRAAHREVEPIDPARAIDVQRFGAIPNDNIDDSGAFSRACVEACATGQPVLIPVGTYEIDKNTTITCTGNLHLIGRGEVHINLDGLLTFRADAADEAITLKADAARKSHSLTVADARKCSVGDLVYINTTVPAESAWKTPKREVHRIQAIDGATITFEEPLVFSHRTTDTGVAISAYRKRRIAMDDLVFDVNDRQLATLYFSGGTLLRHCRWTERDVGQQDGYHYSPSNSIDVVISDATFEGGTYGCVPACCRNAVLERIQGFRCGGHVIAPSLWCHNVHINTLRGSQCGSLVDSHPCFEVHYNDVSGDIVGMPNLRCLGGSIRNYHVQTTRREPGSVYLQSIVLLVDTEIYDETTLLLENFTLVTPNLDPNHPTNRVVALYGRQAVLDNVNWWGFDFYPGPNKAHGFRDVSISNSQLTRLSLWPEQQGTIRHCRFDGALPGGGRMTTALGISANASCSTSDTSFQGYSHVLSVSGPRNASFTDCRFVNCDTIFAPPRAAPKVYFGACTFDHVAGWGDIDRSNVRLDNCTFTPGGPGWINH